MFKEEEELPRVDVSECSTSSFDFRVLLPKKPKNLSLCG
jgi:hypothetical protein